MEIIKSKEQKGKRLKKSEQSQRDLWDTIKQTNIYTVGASVGEKKEKGAERIFEEITAGNFPNLMEHESMNFMMNSRGPTLKHIVIKLSKGNDKWNMGISDVCHFQAWTTKASYPVLHHLCPSPYASLKKRS